MDQELKIEMAKGHYMTARADRIAHWPCQVKWQCQATELEAKAGKKAERDGVGFSKSPAFSPFGPGYIRAIRNKHGWIAVLTGRLPDSSAVSCLFLSPHLPPPSMYRQIGLDMGEMAILQDGGRLCYRVKSRTDTSPHELRLGAS